ncbi:sulfur carrier protein ThiS [Neoehrlichia mikurensis]|uniref:sulfur carrier protein ThiS n=1 Tax=Neoehrlichia mikurensis TaxID=89586 RepID=UPI001C49416A|nr:sulfur carrier protein ThiS [Neoehrlichia mikurensis]QXK92206.1 sulfur carrier protein ThiS [Neoehrlichia mikurensis]
MEFKCIYKNYSYSIINIIIRGKHLINVKINNNSKTLPLNTTLSEVLDNYNAGISFAVALNNKLVPKAHYEGVYLKDGDVIDIVYPMQGG